MAKLVSQVYGDALFALAEEHSMQERFSLELSDMAEVLHAYPQYRALLSHPRLDEEEKWEVFRQVFEGRICAELTGFFRLLLKKGRFEEFDGIAAHFEKRRLAHDRIGVVWVASPFELTDAQKKKIETRLMETTDFVSLQMHYVRQPELIGGLRIRIGDRVVDSSIQNKLNDMKRKLIQIQL